MRHSGWLVRAGLVLFCGAAATGALRADTLVLRDGRRVDGELIAISDGTIEFRERRGSARLLRLDRDAVRAIELEDAVGHGERSGVLRARPRGLREREVVVSADLPFVDSGIDLRAGAEIYFESVGNVWWKSGKKDGPAGERNSPYNAGRPMPRRPAAALIGKVGEDSKDLFFIGSDPGPMRVPTSGRLFLGVNDDYIPDNRGNFRVLVFY